MVLFLFVIMLLNLRQPEEGGAQLHLGQKLIGSSLATGTAALVVYTIFKIKMPAGKETVADFGTTEMVARSLFTEYLLPFEATSILLLVAVVGAVILAKTKLD
jgi:NADH-quinone oxidoreductase subunit J